MLIEREQLAEIIAQEVRLRLAELAEEGSDDEEEDAPARSKGRKPSTTDANSSPSPRGKVPSGPRADSESDPDPPADDPDGSEEDDDADQSDDPGLDPNGNEGEEPSGAVNNEISGKVVQAVTIDPHSKVLPGAKEVVISFSDSTDALRILVTPTGQAKFFWRNQLHDVP